MTTLLKNLKKFKGRLIRVLNSLRPNVESVPYEPVDEPFSGADPFEYPVKLEIGDVFDLHPIAPAQCRAVVEEYLREAHSRGFTALRIIHGKGIGVQRRMVREVLSQTAFVEWYGDAPPEAGGFGATIVTIRRDESTGESGGESG